MKLPLFSRSARSDTISSLYGTIVAQARLPSFYRDFAVADSINGRFDLLVLHLGLAIGRLEEAGLRALGQGLFDRFCQDMDHNLREMGVGDLSVPKEMRRIGEAFYGRTQAYRTALASRDQGDLTDVVARNIYDSAPASRASAGRLAAYMLEAVRDLKGQSAASLQAGHLRLPDPVLIPIVEDKSSGLED
jgi:cytochrome b pre-mRNA-processing protein 3